MDGQLKHTRPLTEMRYARALTHSYSLLRTYTCAAIKIILLFRTDDQMMEGCGVREREGRGKEWREWTAAWPDITQQLIYKSNRLTTPCVWLFVFMVVLIFLSFVRKHKCVMCGCVFCETRKREEEGESIYICLFFSSFSISHIPLICLIFVVCVCAWLCNVSLLLMVSLFIMVPV